MRIRYSRTVMVNKENYYEEYMYTVYAKYRKTENFRVVQFSRNFAVSINPRKLKSAKHFPIFEKLVLRN